MPPRRGVSPKDKPWKSSSPVNDRLSRPCGAPADGRPYIKRYRPDQFRVKPPEDTKGSRPLIGRKGTP